MSESDETLMTSEWEAFAINIAKLIKDENLQQELVPWSNQAVFQEEYTPPSGALLRGMHDLTEEAVKELLVNGVPSRLLMKYNDDFEKVRKHLTGRDITREFLTHYLGAGKGDLFWESHDESPFVGLASSKDAALWHASQGNKFRIIFELVPKLLQNPLDYHALQTTPKDQRVEGYDANRHIGGDILQESTFNYPFVRIAGQEVAFYPKIDSIDIAKVHLLPNKLMVQKPSDI